MLVKHRSFLGALAIRIHCREIDDLHQTSAKLLQYQKLGLRLIQIVLLTFVRLRDHALNRCLNHVRCQKVARLLRWYLRRVGALALQPLQIGGPHSHQLLVALCGGAAGVGRRRRRQHRDTGHTAGMLLLMIMMMMAVLVAAQVQSREFIHVVAVCVCVCVRAERTIGQFNGISQIGFGMVTLTDTLAVCRARNFRLVALAVVLQAAGALAVAALVVTAQRRIGGVLALADFRPARRRSKRQKRAASLKIVIHVRFSTANGIQLICNGHL